MTEVASFLADSLNSKAIPIHCIVEKARRQDDRLLGNPTNQSSFVREHDTYVIVPSHVPVGDLVRIALIRIGYTASEGSRARGMNTNEHPVQT